MSGHKTLLRSWNNRKKFDIFSLLYNYGWGRRWRSWFGHCSTNRKVAGLILDVVLGIFH
jgi:hypothetical protein